MPLPTSSENLLYGKGRLYFWPDVAPSEEAGYLDLGEVPKFEVNVEVERTEKFSNRSGVKEKILDFVNQKKAESSFELEEYSAEILNLAFLGDGVQSAAQSAGQIDNQAITMVANRFIQIGAIRRHALTYRKISHGLVTGNTFALGETITGGTSAKTAKVVRIGSGFLEVINDQGIQANEVVTGGTSAATATTTGLETVKDAIVMPASQIGTRTAVGTPTGTNLPTASGCFHGEANIDFRVKISTAGTPDKFRYSLDGGVNWSAEINCAVAATYCAQGISIAWSGTTGGVLNDTWKWELTARYRPGIDYDADAQGGMIRKRSTGGIGASAQVSADYPVRTLKSVRALAKSENEGKLLFVGDPDQGPKWVIDGWKVKLTIGGGAGFISDDTTPIPMTASFQSDRTNHPTEPFFRATEVAA